MSKKQTADELLADTVAEYWDDPLGYVMFMFPWDKDPALQVVPLQEPYASRFNSQFGPDVWACEFLDDLAEQVKLRDFDGHTPVEPIQFSTASGHGIGKSTLVAWLIKWIMDTRPGSRGTVTANTADQLRTKTWAELGKWHKRSLTEHWFDFSSGRGSMSLKHKQQKEEWYCQAATCREENSESFAGQHAATASSFYIFDEASAVPAKIYEVREGGLTDGHPMTFDFGNPTRNSGKFHENTVGKMKHNYLTRQIDSRDVFLANNKLFERWIKDYGITSDFVKVRILGQFPDQGSTQFMNASDVEDAMSREVEQQGPAARVLGVDVARFGDDDSVIFPRKGNDCRSFKPASFNGLNTVQLCERVKETYRFFKNLGDEPAMIFVDGGGVGGGVVDQLQAAGYPVTEVGFGTTPTDANTYRFKADEMWGNLRDELPKLWLPSRDTDHGQRLFEELTAREFGYTITGQKINLETKKDMKLRGVPSPDMADALVLTFASDVLPGAPGLSMFPDYNGQQAVDDYDPYADLT